MEEGRISYAAYTDEQLEHEADQLSQGQSPNRAIALAREIERRWRRVVRERKDSKLTSYRFHVVRFNEMDIKSRRTLVLRYLCWTWIVGIVWAAIFYLANTVALVIWQLAARAMGWGVDAISRAIIGVVVAAILAFPYARWFLGWISRQRFGSYRVVFVRDASSDAP